MRRIALWTTAVALLLGGGVLGYRHAQAAAERGDCPGKIVCPITGELICADQCPLSHASTRAR